ncbi:MAG: CxxC-x17-CxxC domain-containing protein [Patescibacteria group bacterium]
MSDYSKPRFAKPSFNRGGKDRFSDSKQMHKANCSKCNNVCEVPFRPNGKKPVFCSNCFVKDDAPRTSYGPKREFSPRPSFNATPPRENQDMKELKMHMQGVNDKLTRLIHLMESAQAPVAEKTALKKVIKKVTKKK